MKDFMKILFEALEDCDAECPVHSNAETTVPDPDLVTQAQLNVLTAPQMRKLAMAATASAENSLRMVKHSSTREIMEFRTRMADFRMNLAALWLELEERALADHDESGDEDRVEVERLSLHRLQLAKALAEVREERGNAEVALKQMEIARDQLVAEVNDLKDKLEIALQHKVDAEEALEIANEERNAQSERADRLQDRLDAKD